MGQTLSHGVYLPNEGERNCYAGLASNWQILNTAVGNIAEKAPLVHAHGNISNDGKVGTTANLPLITGTGGVVQAGSFGNAANTFCEGNDSRLSDARTPVAHTHGKADITDLFNSANTWSGDNTFSKQVCLTKVNDTSLKFKNSRAELGETNLSGDTYTQISFEDKNGDNFGYLRQIYGADGNNGFHFYVRNKFLNGVPDTTGTIDYAYFGIILGANKSKEAVFKANLRPYDSTNAYNLGNSTYKWKTLNGINPGALSLPDLNTAQTIDRTDWAYDGSTYNSIKLSSTDTNMTKNGWLYVRINSTGSSDKLSIKYNSTADRYPTSSFGDTGGCIEVFVPVIANSNVYLCATKDLQFCKFYPCLGNVPSGV